MFFAFAVTTTFRHNRGIMVARAIDGGVPGCPSSHARGTSRIIAFVKIVGLNHVTCSCVVLL
jgi:hypothetical protein